LAKAGRSNARHCAVDGLSPTTSGPRGRTGASRSAAELGVCGVPLSFDPRLPPPNPPYCALLLLSLLFTRSLLLTFFRCSSCVARAVAGAGRACVRRRFSLVRGRRCQVLPAPPPRTCQLCGAFLWYGNRCRAKNPLGRGGGEMAVCPANAEGAAALKPEPGALTPPQKQKS